MKKIRGLLKDFFIVFFIVFSLFEISLRLVPGLIPPYMLLYFNKDLRHEIAARQNLPLADQTYEITRDDSGPALHIYKPGITIENQFTDVGSKTVTVDENGFCNEPTTYSNNDSFDIVTIGDSFTFCTNVHYSETWSDSLGKKLSATVYNLGSPAKGMYEYLQILKNFGLEKRPKIVVMAVYEGNDLRDAIKYHDYINQAGTGEKNREEDCGGSRVCELYITLQNNRIGMYSYAYNLSLVSVRMLRAWFINAKNGVEHVRDFSYSMEGSGGVIVLNPDNTDEDEVINARKLQNGEVALDVFDDALDEFVRLAKENNFRPIIVYIPSAYTAYQNEIKFADAELLPIMENYSRQQRAYFSNKAQELSVVYIDTTEDLVRIAGDYKAKEKLLYFPHNVHLTPYGHTIVSKSIYQIMYDWH